MHWPFFSPAASLAASFLISSVSSKDSIKPELHKSKTLVKASTSGDEKDSTKIKWEKAERPQFDKKNPKYHPSDSPDAWKPASDKISNIREFKPFYFNIKKK